MVDWYMNKEGATFVKALISGLFILEKSLDDFYVRYELNVYTDKPLEMQEIYSELHQNMQDASNEYGVLIMSPSYRSDPDRPKVVPKDQWYAPPAKPPDDLEKKG